MKRLVWISDIMKIKELRQKSTRELQVLLEQSQKKLSQLRFDLNSKKLKNVREIPLNKKLIAKILTILKEKEYAEDKKQS